MDKRTGVVVGDQVHDVLVPAGTTAQDILTQLSLPTEYVLSKRDAQPFGDTELIYDAIRDGDKLYASPPAIVG